MRREVSRKVLERASNISFVLMDVDGVLTDGRLYMRGNGSEGKTFHTHDGHGIRMGQRGGLRFGILSGRESKVVAERAQELSITEVHQRIYNKAECFEQILRQHQLAEEAVCYIGDDLIDLPVMRRAGLAIAPANAVPEVIEAAHYVTEREGGNGAVREAVDLLLRAKGNWDSVTERYFR